MNWYAYVGNDPVNMVDPTGESAVLLSPKFTPRLSPIAQGVRQGIKSGQTKTNTVQQQTQKIANQMRNTVKNSQPEVRQPSLREAPKAASDTTGGIVSRLISQLIKHAEDFVGGNAGANTNIPDASSSQDMDNDTKRFMAEAQILMAPPAPLTLPEPDAI
jgi:hypothetical protein